MSAELLTGLWEFKGYVEPKSGKIVAPTFGMEEEAVREFLYFSGSGTFFWAKYPKNAHLAFDPETELLFSNPPYDPLLRGTWVLRGTLLIEQLHHPSGEKTENRVELPKITKELLVVREAATTGTIDVVYLRQDTEQFAAPPLLRNSDSILPEVEVNPEGLGRYIDEIQQQQFQIQKLVHSGKLNTAHRLAQRSYQRAEEIFGSQDPNTATCLSTLGAVAVKVKDTATAIELLERSLAILQALSNSPEQAVSNVFNNLSFAYRADNQFGGALKYAVAAVRSRSKVFGFENPATLISVQNLGMALSGLGYMGPAFECYTVQKALASMAGSMQHYSSGASNHNSLVSRLAQDFPYASTQREERLDLHPEATLTRILEECELMLEDAPVTNQEFLLKYGQAADTSSYFHLVYALKSALMDTSPTEESSVATEGIIQKANSVRKRLLVSCRIPLTLFDGTLKRMARSQLGPMSKATLECVFPHFDGRPESKHRIDEILKKYGINPDETPTLLKDRQERMEQLKMLKQKISHRQYRRFGGDHNLPAQRYSSVCSQDVASDEGTLARELFEYTNLHFPGVVFVGDSADTTLISKIPEAVRQPIMRGREGIFVFLLAPLKDQERQLFRELYGPVLEQLHGPYGNGNDRWDGLSIVFIPIEYQQHEIPDVLDLRQRATQDWFWQYFQYGDGAILLKEQRQSLIGFTDMLPALVYPEYGGSGVTKSIGSWLRTMGVNGLVFPSARSDASVTWDQDHQLISWRGWNFVDYRGLQYTPDSLVHLDTNPWYDFVAGRQEAPVLEADELSWSINGTEARYQMVRNFMLQLLDHGNTASSW